MELQANTDGEQQQEQQHRANGSSSSSKKHRLTAERLSVHVGEKQLLFDVSAVAESGRLLAVMGPSGSGKTTFMNTVSGRMPLSSGKILLNGRPLSTPVRKSFGYVTQGDVFFAMLTLRQCVEFAARVKLPSSVSAAERQRRIESVITSLKLEKCMNTIIGNFIQPGLSGGEKKRANIACELLPNPDVLLLDEPTSGLDSNLSLTLIDLLSDWAANENKIVMMSIHQPSSKLFHKFADLLLLTDGHTSYFGQRSGMVDYFAEIGVPFEPLWNPADYMLEVVKHSSDSKQLIIDKGAAFSDLTDRASSSHNGDSFSQPKSHQLTDPDNGDTAIQLQKPEVEFSNKREGVNRPGWGRQLFALSIRGFHVSRYRLLSPEPIIRTCTIGILSALLWFQIAKTENHIRDILGCIFFMTTNLSFAPMLEAIFAFQEDLQVVKHERKAGMYQIGAYYTAKLLTEMPLTILVPLISLSVLFWTAGLGGFSQYLLFVMATLVNCLACQGVGTFFGLLTDMPRANLTIAVIFMLMSLLLGGFLATTVPVWLVWLKYASIIRYCFHFSMLTVFEGVPNYLCTQSQRSPYPACINSTILNSMNQSELPTSEILSQYPDTFLPKWVNFGIILVYLLVFRIAAYLYLRFLKKL